MEKLCIHFLTDIYRCTFISCSFHKDVWIASKSCRTELTSAVGSVAELKGLILIKKLQTASQQKVRTFLFFFAQNLSLNKGFVIRNLQFMSLDVIHVIQVNLNEFFPFLSLCSCEWKFLAGCQGRVNILCVLGSV